MNLLKKLKICTVVVVLTLFTNSLHAQITYDISHDEALKAVLAAKKNAEELLAELKKNREELQNIRFTKVSGTAVAKLSKIKILRRSIARCLTVINGNKKAQSLENLRKRNKTKTEDDSE